MSFIGSMLGAGKGSDFVAQGQPSGVQMPTTNDQVNTAYGNSQDALGQANSALALQQALQQATAAQNGLGNQSQVYGQLQGVANGTGPNPAQNMLSQATGQNVANQQALMAGQRGASANVGLMARQAAQGGAGIQQQAAGQAATMQSQQQLNALTGAGNMANTQAGQQIGATQNVMNSALGVNQAAQGEQFGLTNAIAQQNNALVGMQSNVNTTNSATQIQNSKAQQGIFGGLLGGAGSILAKGGEVGVDGYADGGSIMPTPPAQIQSGPQSSLGKFIYGASSSQNTHLPTFMDMGREQDNSSPTSGGAGILGQKIAEKGIKPLINALFNSAPTSTPMAGGAGDATGLPATEGTGGIPAGSTEGAMADQGATEMASAAGEGAAAEEGGEGAVGLAELVAAKGGKVPAMVSPGEKYLTPKQATKVATGKESPMKGKTVPGKAKVKGDSYSNDTVHMTLESGGVVIPKSVMESKNPERSAAEFVRKVLAKKGLRK